MCKRYPVAEALQKRGQHEVASLARTATGVRRRTLERRVVCLFGVIDANMGCKSLSRCDSKAYIISSKDLLVGVPDVLERQPHSEQPNPRKRCCSIHTSFLLMAANFTGSNLNGLSGILPKRGVWGKPHFS